MLFSAVYISQLTSEVHILYFNSDFQIVLAICQIIHGCCFVFGGLSARVLKEKVNGALDSLPIIIFSLCRHQLSGSQTVISQHNEWLSQGRGQPAPLPWGARRERGGFMVPAAELLPQTSAS